MSVFRGNISQVEYMQAYIRTILETMEQIKLSHMDFPKLEAGIEGGKTKAMS